MWDISLAAHGPSVAVVQVSKKKGASLVLAPDVPAVCNGLESIIGSLLSQLGLLPPGQASDVLRCAERFYTVPKNARLVLGLLGELLLVHADRSADYAFMVIH